MHRVAMDVTRLRAPCGHGHGYTGLSRTTGMQNFLLICRKDHVVMVNGEKRVTVEHAHLKEIEAAFRKLKRVKF